jgi:hypothetical protein
VIDKNIAHMTYNDLAFLSFGEAQALKKQIDGLVDEVFDLAVENAELKGEIHE